MPDCIAQKSKLSDLGEFGLINRLKGISVNSSSVVQGIGDDTAVIRLSSQKYLLLTTDMLLEGVHFTKKMPPRSIGHKAIAVNISDIAAMGGLAKYAVISLGAPATCSWKFISDIYEGIKKTAKDFNVSIIGGDTIESEKIIINVSVVGEARKTDIIYRNGAKKGNQIFVTGPLGKSFNSNWHMSFNPRIAQAQYLVKRYKPTAMIDISDGLASDLGHICTESKVGAVLDGCLIPCRSDAELNNALYDGEDFELLFTLSASDSRKLKKLNYRKYSFFHIGEIVDRREGFQIRTNNGTLKKIDPKGYKHF